MYYRLPRLQAAVGAVPDVMPVNDRHSIQKGILLFRSFEWQTRYLEKEDTFSVIYRPQHIVRFR